MKVFALYVEYGVERRQSLLSFHEWLQTSFQSAEIKLIVIQNNPRTVLDQPVDATTLHGDNRFHEFSGWQLAIDRFVLPHATDQDLVVLANDSIVANYGKALFRLFYAPEFNRKLAEGKVIGYEDRYLEPVTLMGHTGDRWLRSNLLIFRLKELKLVLPLVVPLTDEKIFCDSDDTLFLPGHTVSTNFCQYLDCWLHRAPGRPEFKAHWHGSETLTPQSRPRLKQKARMIFFEFLLSQRILTQSQGWWNVRTSIRNKMGFWWLASWLGLKEQAEKLLVRLRSA